MPSTTEKASYHTASDPGLSFLLDIPYRSGSETAAQGSRAFLATVCTSLLPTHDFASPCGLQRGKKKNKALLMANFSMHEVIA